MGEHILVIGATLLDARGKPLAGLEPGTSNPADLLITRGGTARNVAENLGRLGADVILISAVGQDIIGDQLLAQTADAQVNVSYVLQEKDYHTGAYLALLEDDGSLSVALDDVSIMHVITSGYLHRHRRLFRDASLIMMDGSLSPEAMISVARLAARYSVPLCADPSSARLAHKLRPFLPQLRLVVPNVMEAAALLSIDPPDNDPDSSLSLARQLVQSGVEIAVLTLANYGISYATSDEVGYIPPRYGSVVDNTGTGDAVTAAIMFGLLNELPVIEALRLGAAAAGLTVQTNDTVVRDLSLDMLYEHLIV
jgi:pseudouridine kinase